MKSHVLEGDVCDAIPRTLLGAPGLTTRNKKLLGTKGIATRSKDASRLEAIAFRLEAFALRPSMQSVSKL